VDVYVLAGKNNIVVYGTDPIGGDTVRVVIQNASDGSIVFNDSYSPVPADTFESQTYSVPPGTYNVSVYWNEGNSASLFNGVVVPPPDGNSATFGPDTTEGKALQQSGAPAGKYLRHKPSHTYPPPKPPPAPPNPKHLAPPSH
jgi:hypothetical protein